MATSRSPDAEEWTAGALVFSGRPDPTWPLAPSVAEGLAALWETLSPWEGPLPEAPVLGYRGSFVMNGSGRTWLAHGGAVTLTEAESATARRDAGRMFERRILDSAPPGILPTWKLAGAN